MMQYLHATPRTLDASTFALAACGGAEETAEEPTTAADAAAEEEMTEDDMTSEDDMDDDIASEEAMGDPAANLVGAGGVDYTEAVPDGAGLVEGMGQDPVAVAAGNNPLLTALVAAVSGEVNPDVDLVGTLNGDEFTAFAPVDDAFAQIDEEMMGTLAEDAELLSSILTYHVVPAQLTPDQVTGEQTTVQGGTVEVTGEYEELMVNGAMVICGGVQTANATVYLIDEVLMPQG